MPITFFNSGERNLELSQIADSVFGVNGDSSKDGMVVVAVQRPQVYHETLRTVQPFGVVACVLTVANVAGDFHACPRQ